MQNTTYKCDPLTRSRVIRGDTSNYPSRQLEWNLEINKYEWQRATWGRHATRRDLHTVCVATRHTLHAGRTWANVGRRVKDICHKRWLRNKYRCCYTGTNNWVCSWLVKQTILFQYTLFLVQNMKNTNGLQLNQHLETKSYVRLECTNVQYQYLPNW